MALAEAYKEGIWLRRLLRELGQKTEPVFPDLLRQPRGCRLGLEPRSSQKNETYRYQIPCGPRSCGSWEEGCLYSLSTPVTSLPMLLLRH